MYTHAPPGYACPFCHIAGSMQNGAVPSTTTEDVFLRNEQITAFVAAAWWPKNPGHVLVIPNEHFENIFDLPVALAAEIHRLAREVAFAFKTVYGCAGVSTRQHNEPAGDQDVWHYHLHVFPRYEADDLYRSQRRFTSPEERLPYSTRLRAYLAGRPFPANSSTKG